MKSNTRIIYLIFVLLLFNGKLLSQEDNRNSRGPNIMFQKISQVKITHNFKNRNLFEIDKSDKSQDIDKFVKKATFLKLDKKKLNDLINSKDENIVLRIPISEEKDIELELAETKVLADDFKVGVISQKGKEYVDYKPGRYYQGIVKGDNQSIAALSVFEDFVMCVFSNKDGNFVLGHKQNEKELGNYVLYNDNDMLVKNPFTCKELPINFSSPEKHERKFNREFLPLGSPVKIYFDCELLMYLALGSSIPNCINYVTGMYNVVSVIFNNLNIPTLINGIGVFTWLDPFWYIHDKVEILDRFRQLNSSNNYEVNLSHLLGMRTNPRLGGIAYVAYSPGPTLPGLLCNNSYNYAFSDIDSYYYGFPTYSWTVNVVAHENGHVFGSVHTHSRCWPNGPFEICAPCQTEQHCVYPFNCPVSPNYNATIMSYCHLNGSINLSYGFGSVPGNLINNNYNNANCIHNFCLNGPRQISGSPPVFEGTYITAPCNSPSPVEVLSGANVTFRAGTSITLLPGFTAHNGATFSAYIQPYEPGGDLASSNLGNRNAVVISSDKENQLPKEFSLSQNYPNPFNPTTLIQYALKENSNVKITVYDILGRVVKTLVNEFQDAGYKEVAWDGTNNSGVNVSTGIYIYKIEVRQGESSTVSFIDSKKSLLIK